jgi:hypothetical protein
MSINLASQWRLVPSSNYETLNDVWVGSLLIAFVQAAMLYVHAVQVGSRPIHTLKDNMLFCK